MLRRIRASTVCVHDHRLLVVYLEEPRTGEVRPYLPGGEVESEEKPHEAATRETREETGYLVETDPQSCKILDYPFPWNGQTYHCTTYFFRARLIDPHAAPQPVVDENLVRGVDWMTQQEVEDQLGYHQGILAKILALWPT